MPPNKSNDDDDQDEYVDEHGEDQKPVEIPSAMLSSEAFAGIIESFILREGTDYGSQEAGHETKVRQVRDQIQAGKVKIVFDPTTESVTLMTEREWKKISS